MNRTNDNMQEVNMWTKPNYEEIRLGFEVTLYISHR